MSHDNQPPLMPRILELGGYRWERLKNKHFGHMYNSKGECIGRGVPYKEALELLTPTPLCILPASPVTRSAEVTEAVNMVIGGERAHPLSEKWRKCVLNYIAQIEASQPKSKSLDDEIKELGLVRIGNGYEGPTVFQPKPQSEAGLREALARLATNEAFTAMGSKHVIDLRDPLHRELQARREFAKAALSQAPVPMHTDEECARHILRTTATEGDHEEEVTRLSAILARHRQSSAPVPTSGAVEWGEVLEALKSNNAVLGAIRAYPAGWDINFLTDMQNVVCENIRLISIVKHLFLSAQPPAADGKLREALEYRIFKDGNAWCATDNSFINLQESHSGFGETAIIALATLLYGGEL